MYTSCMNKLKTLAAVVYLVTSQTGCAVYMIASGATVVASGKGITDHAVSAATGYDCDTVNSLKKNQDYWCEQRRDSGTHYPRSW